MPWLTAIKPCHRARNKPRGGGPVQSRPQPSRHSHSRSSSPAPPLFAPRHASLLLRSARRGAKQIDHVAWDRDHNDAVSGNEMLSPFPSQTKNPNTMGHRGSDISVRHRLLGGLLGGLRLGGCCLRLGTTLARGLACCLCHSSPSVKVPRIYSSRSMQTKEGPPQLKRSSKPTEAPPQGSKQFCLAPLLRELWRGGICVSHGNKNPAPTPQPRQGRHRPGQSR